ncbi:MAG: diacylglycerol kinase family lipid kinase [Gemmatimonadales bacterium]|jgi:YegS/Rv2252/BmrU family lipid kinase
MNPDDKRAFIILNPMAGRGKGRGQEQPLASAAREAGWDVVARLTRYAGEEKELAVEAREAGWPVVVAAGGDGTVHNVANGLLADGPTSVTLAHVPVGTGNDYARSIGLKPRPVQRNLTLVLGGHVRRLDVGKMGDEYFVNHMGVGFDAEAARHTLQMTRLNGFPLYLAAVYKTFGSFVPPEIEVQAAEHIERSHMMMLGITIGATMGGGFRVTPDASIDDGLFDVCVIRRVGLLRFLRYVPSVVLGTHVGLPEVTMFRTKQVTVTGHSSQLAIQADGELRYPEHETIDVKILPHYLSVLCVP